MHIAHVGVSFEPDTMHGPTRAVSAYAAEQAALGHHVTMVSFSAHALYRRRQLAGGIDEVVLPVPKLTVVLGRRASRFFAANELAADVFHFHSASARHWAAGRLLRVPYLVSPHGAFLPTNLLQRRIWTSTYRALIGRSHLRRAAFVHAITPAEDASVRRYAGAGVRVALVPNALQASEPPGPTERLATRKRLRLTDNELLVLYVGRLDVHGKGLDALLEGFALARRRLPSRPMRLLLAGPTWQEADLARLVPADARDSVTVVPPVLGDEKRALLAAADIFATLSRWDVMPTAVLDALGLGLPLLVSEETGFGDFVRAHAAGRVAVHDAVAVADALCGFESPQALLSGRSARIEAAAAEFHPRLIAQRFLDLYTRAGASHGL